MEIIRKPVKPDTVPLNSLTPGDTFEANKTIYLTCSSSGYGINLETGELRWWGYTHQVRPVKCKVVEE